MDRLEQKQIEKQLVSHHAVMVPEQSSNTALQAREVLENTHGEVGGPSNRYPGIPFISQNYTLLQHPLSFAQKCKECNPKTHHGGVKTSNMDCFIETWTFPWWHPCASQLFHPILHSARWVLD
jgi:hypothetical protein